MRTLHHQDNYEQEQQYSADKLNHWFEEFSISTNPLALYSAAAQHTKSIRFRTCSHVVPLHNPMVFAGQLAAAQLLTNNRIEVAFGRGHAWVFPKASIPLEESKEVLSFA
ncbi:LLM class flavin-dependent oxidoreductase [Aneurinibacillus aneurinilyticus]|uniref:LLM class flavin-dependent oxidoreductase n=1 Tax=Aneurinibacillus aneurinilyticus TaxID=1391 RepID=A0A848CWR9_ANEAE|nr:LLM class flavin-dependent oxidoreductase [Aneurinibacillus aneurinilyticus]MCI1696824.1 LLM class flavin-dependent oxidoreductase [Aneurinibacillus aneurinilyticus]NME97982.1 LLM class flavin-dependent oxidoreductase [Aneurinibacillus aneurinilyticus]